MISLFKLERTQVKSVVQIGTQIERLACPANEQASAVIDATEVAAAASGNSQAVLAALISRHTHP